MNSYLLTNKKKKFIIESSDHFFTFFGVPDEFGCENGREFVNSKVLEFLNNKKIKKINGALYNSHSRGVVERVHITIRKGLFVEYLGNPINLNLEKSLALVINIYNKSIHGVTNYPSNELFFCNDSEKYKKAFSNIFTYYQQHNKANNTFYINEYCLLS